MMATEAQRLVQHRSRLLRDLAGCRAQLSRIEREFHELSKSCEVKLPTEPTWLRHTKDLILDMDERCRKSWGYRPIQTYEHWLAEFEAKHARKMNKLAKKFPKIPTEPNHEPT